MFQTEHSTEILVRNKITFITFICSLLVIWIHTFNLVTYGIDENSVGFSKAVLLIENSFAALTQIAVPFFFFVSGFLFYRTFELKNIKVKYISRIKGILIPYIIWCSVYYLYYVLVTNLPYVQTLVNSDLIPLTLIGWLKALWPESYYTLWFLKEIIIYIAICPLIYFAFKNRYIGGVLLIALFINNHFGFIGIPAGGYLYYLTGAYIALAYKGAEYYKNKISTIIGCVFLIAMLVTRFTLIGNIYIRLAFFIATWFAVDLVARDKEYPWWMKITFFTYVAHDLFLEMFEKLVLITFGTKPIFALLDYIFVPVIVFAFLVAIAIVLKRYLPIVWKIITGMRV